MTISDYQIGSVIQTYMKNMKIKVKENEGGLIQKPKNDEVSISREGMRKILYDRIGEQVIERSKKYEQQ
ncbi:MAG TPA: hypothetical protein PK125_06115 [Syntrophorhabdus sp.]|nr:hypothetical protein [Syntrophorhabdus sp.]MDI9557121.1 hypothetical protein [Pseudomonadota bacterium]MBP8745319.1 hypothetical protein [Syntrophorhabdus sp.]NMC93048.1 hypothetical protein [Syntrophorhabdus sp.]HOH27188.1 hypothetical protein [Syntrophorhabdus sp.]